MSHISHWRREEDGSEVGVIRYDGSPESIEQIKEWVGDVSIINGTIYAVVAGEVMLIHPSECVIQTTRGEIYVQGLADLETTCYPLEKGWMLGK